jgi:hypothetical protein
MGLCEFHQEHVEFHRVSPACHPDCGRKGAEPTPALREPSAVPQRPAKSTTLPEPTAPQRGLQSFVSQVVRRKKLKKLKKLKNEKEKERSRNPEFYGNLLMILMCVGFVLTNYILIILLCSHLII